MNKTLIRVQQELKAPKTKLNAFGGFSYRCAEDILEAVKPLLSKHGAQLTLSDEIVVAGAHEYLKSTAVFESEEGAVTVTAYARHAESRKGMDDSQITGSASSYARKYALGGLFLIDNEVDPDSLVRLGENNGAGQTAGPTAGQPVPPRPPMPVRR